MGPFVWRWYPDAEPTAEFEVMARPRRQELTKETYRYRENGSMYITKTRVYTEHHNRLAGYPGGSIDLFILDEIEGVDIDAPHRFLSCRASAGADSRILKSSSLNSLKHNTSQFNRNYIP